VHDREAVAAFSRYKSCLVSVALGFLVFEFFDKGEPTRELWHRLWSPSLPEESSVVSMDDEVWCGQILMELLEPIYDSKELFPSCFIA